MWNLMYVCHCAKDWKDPMKMMDDFSQFFCISIKFLLSDFLFAFDFYFLPAVVVGIVVAGTEIRAQACMSAKAAAACEYWGVVGCVDPKNPAPSPSHPTAQLLVSLSAAHCCPVTAALKSQTQTIALFILHTARGNFQPRDTDSWAVPPSWIVRLCSMSLTRKRATVNVNRPLVSLATLWPF